MAENDSSLYYICDFYLNIADQLLTQPEGVIPRELSDKDLFNLLSDFYLNVSNTNQKESENSLDF